ncbi:hypothetical protein [Streptomyces sp. CMSTAAHL-2]|uniref:hypothetical protein n=1 Tax=Streptomyces sp. CMSTAAHL-2 TaxID=2904522 RepID=UPI001E559CEA|nr:hypothetical protein [Streptomyces sp. CMSTAAHL-2]MCE3034473.1 hypothetical protein [Streptomyces sp. CMSTAAHL-2]
MTSSLFRGRSRRAKAHIRVRVTHAVLGALVGAGWLMLPLMTAATRRPVPATSPGTLADAAAPGQGGTSAADYVLPLIAVAAAAVLAAYGYLRRVRRTRTRTTPGTTLPGRPAPPTVADAERQARIALVLADDCVRTSREELGFVRERFGVGKDGVDLRGEAEGWAREGWGEKAEAGPPTVDETRAGPIPATGAMADTGTGSGAGAAHGGFEAKAGTRAAAGAGAAGARFETGTDADRPTRPETEAEAGTQAAARAGTTETQSETGTDADRPTPQETEAEAGARAARPGAAPGAAPVGGTLGHPPSGTETQQRATAGVEAESATAAFVHALRGAETELVAAFAIWRRYEQGLPEEAGARRQALVGVVGRCAEAGRRLDAQAAALDQVRGLEGPGAGVALDVAEGRFRGLAARTVAAHATLAALRERYAPSATDPVTGSVEQAKDRLLFATAHLNATRRSIDAADGDGTARNLRAAEGAVAQAEILVTGVERLAARLREAAALVPAALTGAEAELTAARHGRSRTSLATGELNARLAHADGVLAAVREELTGALPYDPLDALRRITRAVDRLDVGRSGVLDTAALLVARTSLDSADDFVTVHRGAVGPQARALLSEAARAPDTGSRTAFEADTAAREARGLAERDVRAHGTPYPDTTTIGLPGAVLGGILLAEDPDGGPPATFGGPATRGRRHVRAPG